MSFVFIGFGEVSYSISKGLRQDFADTIEIAAYDVMLGSGKPIEKTVRERAAEVSARLADSLENAVKDADVVFSAVQGMYSLDVGNSARDFLKNGAIYIDLTTANPTHKAALEESFTAKGIEFVDAAMLGSLPLLLHKVPMLISGTGAVRAETVMRERNMDVTLVEGSAGEASKLKLTRSVFMKGLQALLVETFLFARKAGVENIVMDSITESMDKGAFKTMAERMICADLIHAERRAHEVSDSILVMRDLGINPTMASATVQRLKASAALGYREELTGKAPKSLIEAYALWEKSTMYNPPKSTFLLPAAISTSTPVTSYLAIVTVSSSFPARTRRHCLKRPKNSPPPTRPRAKRQVRVNPTGLGLRNPWKPKAARLSTAYTSTSNASTILCLNHCEYGF